MTSEPAVESPCIGVCKIDTLSGLCLGCLRTGAEIGVWRDASNGERRRILDRIGERKAAGHRTLPARAGSR